MKATKRKTRRGEGFPFGPDGWKKGELQRVQRGDLLHTWRSHAHCQLAKRALTGRINGKTGCRNSLVSRKKLFKNCCWYKLRKLISALFDFRPQVLFFLFILHTLSPFNRSESNGAFFSIVVAQSCIKDLTTNNKKL